MFLVAHRKLSWQHFRNLFLSSFQKNAFFQEIFLWKQKKTIEKSFRRSLVLCTPRKLFWRMCPKFLLSSSKSFAEIVRNLKFTKLSIYFSTKMILWTGTMQVWQSCQFSFEKCPNKPITLFWWIFLQNLSADKKNANLTKVLKKSLIFQYFQLQSDKFPIAFYAIKTKKIGHILANSIKVVIFTAFITGSKMFEFRTKCLI